MAGHGNRDRDHGVGTGGVLFTEGRVAASSTRDTATQTEVGYAGDDEARERRGGRGCVNVGGGGSLVVSWLGPRRIPSLRHPTWHRYPAVVVLADGRRRGGVGGCRRGGMRNEERWVVNEGS